jgi:isovaleryl-CoA dehydrogenase
VFFWTEEQELLRESVASFARSELTPAAAGLDESEGWSDSTFRKMGELGLFGVTANEKYGGSGLGCVEATLVIEKIAEHCASTALSYLAHTILCVNNLHENSSEEQKQRYLSTIFLTSGHSGSLFYTFLEAKNSRLEGLTGFLFCAKIAYDNNSYQKQLGGWDNDGKSIDSSK